MKNPPCTNEKCTLCMACKNACPCDAIYTDTDETGYECLSIDQSRCIDCGKCVSVCEKREHTQGNIPRAVFAAQAKDAKELSKSASGGAFQMLAKHILKNGGVCYGCAMVKDEGGFSARHMRITNEKELAPLLNSKYIPSDTGGCYRLVREDLEAGKTVLYSGVPCQIAGLKAYLGGDNDLLITADLICHGVTGTGIFNSYIRALEKNGGIEITDYQFRDKTVSWGTNYSYTYKKSPDAAEKTRHCPREESSYMMHYLAGNIFRECCYSCTLADTRRVSDFTLGDYWELEREHPEFVTDKPHMSLRGGVSCILVNTDKGLLITEKLKESMYLEEVSLDSVTKHNSNLSKPSARGALRNELLKSYRQNGWEETDRKYREKVGGKMTLYRLKNRLKAIFPDRLRILVYKSPVLSKIIFHG